MDLSERSNESKEDAVGVMGTIVGFGAGYALGANRGAAPIRRAEGMVRDAVAQRLPAPLRSIGTQGSRPVRDVMTAMPQTVSLETPISDTARMMADEGIGDVIVVEQGTGEVVGIVTDRDIAIRAVAKGMDPSTEVGDIYSRDLVALAPTSTVREALDLMRDLNVRRLPVVEHDRALGVVSLGDLSNEPDAGPALADISAASPDR
jgi:CBS domain-containing protein